MCIERGMEKTVSDGDRYSEEDFLTHSPKRVHFKALLSLVVRLVI